MTWMTIKRTLNWTAMMALDIPTLKALKSYHKRIGEQSHLQIQTALSVVGSQDPHDRPYPQSNQGYLLKTRANPQEARSEKRRLQIQAQTVQNLEHLMASLHQPYCRSGVLWSFYDSASSSPK
jgi:hypothetical protein